MASAAPRVLRWRAPTDAATVAPTDRGSLTTARSTQEQPSPNRLPTPATTARASRVFPQPAGPVNVSKREVTSSSSMALTSRSRPTRSVRRLGGPVALTWGSAGDGTPVWFLDPDILSPHRHPVLSAPRISTRRQPTRLRRPAGEVTVLRGAYHPSAFV